MEGLHYLCSKTIGVDQLRSYCSADLHLCFRICIRPVSLHMAQIKKVYAMISLFSVDLRLLQL